MSGRAEAATVCSACDNTHPQTQIIQNLPTEISVDAHASSRMRVSCVYVYASLCVCACVFVFLCVCVSVCLSSCLSVLHVSAHKSSEC